MAARLSTRVRGRLDGIRFHTRRRIFALAVRILSNRFIADALRDSQRRPDVWGDPVNIHAHPSAKLENTLINVNSGHVYIGANSFFGQEAMLMTGTHDYNKRGRDRHPYPREGGDIVIGEGVFTGARAILIGPVRVGDHSVIAAGAVVTKDVPAGVIVAGVPAKVIRVLDEPGEG